MCRGVDCVTQHSFKKVHSCAVRLQVQAEVTIGMLVVLVLLA